MRKLINEKDLNNKNYGDITKKSIGNYLRILDEEWGCDRDYKMEGGYIIEIETPTDYDYLESMFIDVTKNIAEYVEHIIETDGNEVLVCHYILNADFNVVCVIPMDIAHQNVMDQISEIVRSFD